MLKATYSFVPHRILTYLRHTLPSMTNYDLRILRYEVAVKDKQGEYGTIDCPLLLFVLHKLLSIAVVAISLEQFL